MSSREDEVTGMLITMGTLAVFVLLGFWWGHDIATQKMQREAVRRGFAHWEEPCPPEQHTPSLTGRGFVWNTKWSIAPEY
jgi:hypothetical protein